MCKNCKGHISDGINEQRTNENGKQHNANPSYQNSATITTPTLGSAPEQLTNQRIISGDIIISIILPIIIFIIIIEAAVQKISDDRHLFTFLCKCDWPDFYILQIFFSHFFSVSPVDCMIAQQHITPFASRHLFVPDPIYQPAVRLSDVHRGSL